jgi:hypothetical protein
MLPPLHKLVLSSADTPNHPTVPRTHRSNVLARPVAVISAPSPEELQAEAEFISHQTIEQLNAARLYALLGPQKVCDLFQQCLHSTEGRALILTCMKQWVFLAEHVMPVTVPPSLQHLASEAITRRTIEPFDAARLYALLGRRIVCGLLQHRLRSAEGRMEVLSCTIRPQCYEKWQGLETLVPRYVPYIAHRYSPVQVPSIVVALARSPPYVRLGAVSYFAMDYGGSLGMFYTASKVIPSGAHEHVLGFDAVAGMYAAMRRVGVTEEEVQCLMGPVMVYMASVYGTA